MREVEELHAIIREAVGDDPPELIAAKCAVSRATARRWKAARGLVLPSLGAMQRLFDAYAVGTREQNRALELWRAAREVGT